MYLSLAECIGLEFIDLLIEVKFTDVIELHTYIYYYCCDLGTWAAWG